MTLCLVPNLLSNTWKNLIFTSGDGIRGIDGTKIKITFKQYFDTINGIDDAAFGLENSIALLANSNYFARTMEIMHVGEVKDCVIEPAEAYMFNTLPYKYFIPVIATIKGILPKKASYLIDQMPLSFVSFKWKTATLSGYIIELSVDLARNTDNEIKLLLTSRSNLLNMV
ncbi:hypothetical protein [Pedobacter nyackensis]|uniref:hypothetical protein n=1 Tax=Pedobacter nyackensis TaxID=475255 RepID=UPI0029314CF2|nr:hypothetical protein [Pedobacter nyackensis]